MDTEREDAIRLANKVLDTPNRDPDDDLSMMSRQFLRVLEEAKFHKEQSAKRKDELLTVKYGPGAA